MLLKMWHFCVILLLLVSFSDVVTSAKTTYCTKDAKYKFKCTDRKTDEEVIWMEAKVNDLLNPSHVTYGNEVELPVNPNKVILCSFVINKQEDRLYFYYDCSKAPADGKTTLTTTEEPSNAATTTIQDGQSAAVEWTLCPFIALFVLFIYCAPVQ